jgi:hypothetical protein
VNSRNPLALRKMTIETTPSPVSPADAIEAIANQAAPGCGQHYEMFSQKFSAEVDAWIAEQPEGERQALQALSDRHGDYFPAGDRNYVYDEEDGEMREE